MTYFIDESGHSGDLARNGAIPDFGSQPVFTLAAVGFTDEVALQEKLNELKTKHHVRLAELKSSKLVDRPAFVLDVVRLICAGNIPWFVEVMDKKFTVATYILAVQLLPPIHGLIEDQRSHFIKNVLADYIVDKAPDNVFASFAHACVSPSDASLRHQLDSLITFAESAPRDFQAVALLGLAKDALSEYCDALNNGDGEAYKNYLPSPDQNKFDKPVWMLPNQSAFTNIYARINLYEKGNLSKIRLVHDDQFQFDEILASGKLTAEAMQETAAEFFTPHSDFRFRESASLEFSGSSLSVGLEVADVLAGFCMRYTKAFFEDRTLLSSAAHATYDLLRRNTDPISGTGLNLVISTNQHRELSLFVG